MVLLSVMLVAALTGDDSPGPTPGPSVSPTPAVVTDGGFGFEVTAATCGLDNVVTADGRIAAKGQFCDVRVRITNPQQGEAHPVPLACQFLLGASDERYELHRRATRAASGDEPFDQGIGPGETAEVAFQFDVPEDEEAADIELRSTCDSPGVTASVPDQG